MLERRRNERYDAVCFVFPLKDCCMHEKKLKLVIRELWLFIVWFLWIPEQERKVL
jgi:hypothetical protein